jgi:hypothetical protein
MIYRSDPVSEQASADPYSGSKLGADVGRGPCPDAGWDDRRDPLT